MPENQETKRLSAEDFLSELDLAEEWMVWKNPAFEEVELIVKDVTGVLTPFHGPNPLTTNDVAYRAFCIEISKILARK